MAIRIGAPVSGPNHFPRPEVERRLRRALERGHVSFMAPRRTGKTSELIHLVDTAPEDRPHWRINLETCSTPNHWLEALMAPFAGAESRWRRMAGKLGEQLGRIEGLEVVGVGKVRLGEVDWRKPAESFLQLVLEQSQPSTFLLDEFPILVDELAKADLARCKEMLRWFRDWRQRTADTEIRFLVTGSVGLDNVVERHGLWDTVNDFESVDLPPLARKEAVKLLLRLSGDNGVCLTEPLAFKILELIGSAWPYFLQIFVAELQDLEADLTEARLEQVYRDRIVAGPRNQYVKHMWNRLRKVFEPAEQRLAQFLLEAVGQTERGLSRSELRAVAERDALEPEDTADRLAFVLEVLKHDGYLTQQKTGEQRTVFFSNLLRDYWRRRNA